MKKMDDFDLWLKGCEVNNTKIFPLDGEGRTALYKCWGEHLVKHNYIGDTPVYIGWVNGKQVCAVRNYQSALSCWQNEKERRCIDGR